VFEGLSIKFFMVGGWRWQSGLKDRISPIISQRRSCWFGRGILIKSSKCEIILCDTCSECILLRYVIGLIVSERFFFINQKFVELKFLWHTVTRDEAATRRAQLLILLKKKRAEVFNCSTKLFYLWGNWFDCHTRARASKEPLKKKGIQELMRVSCSTPKRTGLNRQPHLGKRQLTENVKSKLRRFHSCVNVRAQKRENKNKNRSCALRRPYHIFTECQATHASQNTLSLSLSLYLLLKKLWLKQKIQYRMREER
jgi:hypothetical protein